MATQPRTAKQLANDQRLKDEAAKRRAERDRPIDPLTEPLPESTETDGQGVASRDDLQRQIDQLMESQALLRAALLGGQQTTQTSVGVSKDGRLTGEVEKYLIDPDNYPDPTPRLSQEPKLVQAINFPFNYELEWRFSTVQYENKQGINMVEPKFEKRQNRIVINDQGEQTNKRYIARRLVFHEDPQAALIIARENNLDIDRSDERVFLNEMRYLRAKEWLFGIFWPKPANPAEEIHEESIGGTLVQVFYKSSEEASAVDFDKLKTKIV